MRWSWALALAFVSIATDVRADGPAATVPPFVVVLGIAQDAGVPQAGTKEHPAWSDAARRRLATCIALVDPVTRERWMFDATPDFKWQLRTLDEVAPAEGRPGLNGIFLTHAHMGHYTGLMHLGHEALGASGVPVYAMPRMTSYLRENGPWDQLVRYENIVLRPLVADSTIQLNARLRVTPFLVPHRQEYSEVVGYRIDGPAHSALFIPDIDSWEEWDALGTRLEDALATVDVAYLDATFFDNGEIPGRDMSGFPHPFIRHTMKRLQHLPAGEKSKVRFIHLNHTNPALNPTGVVRREIEQAGFHVADELEKRKL